MAMKTAGAPIVALLTLALALVSVAPDVAAQPFPNRPITLVLPAPPGDSTDVSGRIMADTLGKMLKVAVVPVNKPGAGGALGTDSVAKAKNDGYTLLLANNAALTTTRILNPDTPYDSLKDLTPLGMTSRAPAVIVVRSEAPYKTLKDLLEHAKTNPGKVQIGTFGAGSIGHFDVEIINSLTGAGLTMVPFRGASPAVTALLGGHVDGAVATTGVVSSHVKSGAVRIVVTSSKIPGSPDVPTLSDLGFSQNLVGVWWGVFGPQGLPADVTGVLVSAIEKMLKDPAIIAKLAAANVTVDYGAPEKVTAEMRNDYRLLEEIARKAGLVKK